MELSIFDRSLKAHASVRVLVLAALGLPLLAAGASAHALPRHGRFASGVGHIARHGGALTVEQDSRTGIVNWRSFSIGKKNSVVFENAGGATLNEIHGGNISRIEGHLNGSGSVYLINNAGIVIGKSGRIDTQGSFAASGGNAIDGTFGADKRLHFASKPKGNVIDNGNITSRAGRVDLYGRNVGVHGTITAKRAETSGRHVDFRGAQVEANWLIDPQNLKVTASAATAIDNHLNGGHDITLKTTATHASGYGTKTNGSGNIVIDAPITWSTTAKLALLAYHGVTINDALHATGKGQVAITDNNGGYLSFGNNGAITFDNLAGSLSIDGNSYTLEDTLAHLQTAIHAAPAGYFALANNINAASLGTFHHAPIQAQLTGTFEGLGHTISNLTIKSGNSHVGLFAQVGTNVMTGTGNIYDLHLSKESITATGADAYVGGLVGYAENPMGAFRDLSVSGTLSGGDASYVGGLIGYDYAPLSNASSSAAVTGISGTYIGGLLGAGEGSGATMTNVHSTGNISDDVYEGYVGGLAGYTYGDIVNSSATGNITASGGGTYAGGLAGYIYGSITNSAATGDINAAGGDSYAGGLIGYAEGATITKSHATGNVVGGGDSYVGGLVGYDYNAISNSYATGKVSADAESDVGGLVGESESSGATITKSHATGDVTGASDGYAGGLVGDAAAVISQSYAKGNVSVPGYDIYAGGLAGEAEQDVKSSYATGNVKGGGDEAQLGGLIGYADGNLITNTYATGNVTNVGGYDAYTGGLIGDNHYKLQNSHATGKVVSGGGYENYTGGLVGYSYGHVANVYAAGDVSGGNGEDNEVGGLLGYAEYGAHDAYATGNVSGAGYNSDIGGLIGYSDDDVTGSYATGNVLGGSGSYDSDVGGLIGFQESGYEVNNSYAKGNVNNRGDEGYAGGLIAYNGGATLTSSHAAGNVTDNGYDIEAGGLVGYNDGAVSGSYATGNVTAKGYETYAGGLAGLTYASIATSHATGNVFVGGYDSEAGGLVGYSNGAVSNSFAKGNVTGGVGATELYIGGLTGLNYSTVTKSYATGNVTAKGSDSYVGGLTGYSDDALSEVYARGDVNGASDSSIGGLAGSNAATVDEAYSTGKVTGSTEDTYIGGLIGTDSSSNGYITNAYWDTQTSGMPVGIGYSTNANTVVARTTHQLKMVPSGLSATYWASNPGKNDGFPILKGVGGQ